MKTSLILTFILFSKLSFCQEFNYDYLKSSQHSGEPTIVETINWLKQNLTIKGGSQNDEVYIDNDGGWRQTEYPCIFMSDSLKQAPVFHYSPERNILSFELDNMGCYAGAYPIETAEITIFLDNLRSEYSYISTGKDRSRRLELNSWNGYKKGSLHSDYVLGYIIFNNDNYCSGIALKTFFKISLPLPQTNSAEDEQFNNAIRYLSKKCSAENKECKDYGVCFVANSKVSINKSENKNINLLSKGDIVLSYDIDKNIFFESEITNIDSFFHDNLTELFFSDDTITCTNDHPFYIENKGWCSLVPQKTMNNYSNYSIIKQLEVGDLFIYKNDNNIVTKKLIGYNFKKSESGEMTFTITSLKHGNTYFVNGLLTGVENLKNLNK